MSHSKQAASDVEDEPHTPLEHSGITGAELNVCLYRALLAKRNAVMKN
jgi:hypothetical protein